jgi:hypothetical protein
MIWCRHVKGRAPHQRPQRPGDVAGEPTDKLAALADTLQGATMLDAHGQPQPLAIGAGDGRRARGCSHTGTLATSLVWKSSTKMPAEDRVEFEARWREGGLGDFPLDASEG